jgi:hypothetical protein
MSRSGNLAKVSSCWLDFPILCWFDILLSVSDLVQNHIRINHEHNETKMPNLISHLKEKAKSSQFLNDLTHKVLISTIKVHFKV